jgi:glycine/D-amino acid oxidase-like deaminating enzyme
MRDVMTPNIPPSDPHGWNELLPAHFSRPALHGDTDADWVIVGAGITGLSCAHHLARIRPNDRIIVLEARNLAQGATARSSGFAVDSSRFGGPVAGLDLNECARVNRINRAGLSILRDLVTTHDIACDWREKGLYHGAAGDAALSEMPHYAAYLKQMELPHTVLSQDDLKARLGTSHYKAGVHVQDGALVQPAALLRGLAAGLPGHVTLYENTPVTGIDRAPVHVVTTPGGQVRCHSVLLATNYEIANLGFLKRRITGVTLTGSFTRRLSDDEIALLGDRPDWGVMSLHDAGATLRLTVDRRICVRNTSEFFQSRLMDQAELAARISRHRAGFETRFPQLRHIPFEFSWSGVEGVSRNRTNFFGELAPRVWFAGGYNGSGISRGTAFGAAMAQCASGQDTNLVHDCRNVAPAKWMPPEPFKSLSGNFAMRGYRKSLGADG